MDVMEKVEKKDFLGKDFLVWLWFKSEVSHGVIEIEDESHAEVRFAGKITLESEDDVKSESITCSGINSRLKEARYALTENKKITQASIKLILGDDEYSFSMDSLWMNYRSFKTPKVLQDDKGDPEGLFYEKVGLMEKAVSTMDSLFLSFIKIRLSPEWEEKELPAVTAWMKRWKIG
ncbi:hypothetical protein ACFL0H_13155 [Thermodesulfobacteriota bacterium]